MPLCTTNRSLKSLRRHCFHGSCGTEKKSRQTKQNRCRLIAIACGIPGNDTKIESMVLPSPLPPQAKSPEHYHTSDGKEESQSKELQEACQYLCQGAPLFLACVVGRLQSPERASAVKALAKGHTALCDRIKKNKQRHERRIASMGIEDLITMLTVA